MVKTASDTFSNLLFAEWMDVDGLPQVVEYCQFCIRVGLCYEALGFAELRPITVRGFVLGCDGAWVACLLTSVVVGQLRNDKRHLLVLPQVAPTAHQFLQEVSIGGRIACV